VKILVTGATGFIGNYVVHGLLKGNHTVIATSANASKAKEKNWFKDVAYIEHDIHRSAGDNLFEKFLRPDIAIHLAWGGLSDFKSQAHISRELPAHLSFLGNLAENGLNSLTVTGTCLEYGMREGELDEAMEGKPVIAYPIAKDLLRKALEGLRLKHQFSFRWVRLFYMHGEGQSPKSILQLLENALNTNEAQFNMSLGAQERDYLPVTDVADKIIALALSPKAEGIINCCSGVPITIKSLVENYLSIKQKTIQLNLGFYPYTDYEPMRFWGSTKKSNSILNDHMSINRQFER
jgi:dTDP-6-deoxy-L-talose 4-dehydrogenase (NAD+)